MAPPARRAPNAPSPKSRKPTDKKPRTKKGVSFSAKAKRNGQSLGKKSFQNGSTMVKKKKFRAAPKKRIEDLSESDLDSDDDLGMNGPEFGLLSDSSSSSDGFDDETDVHVSGIFFQVLTYLLSYLLFIQFSREHIDRYFFLKYIS